MSHVFSFCVLLKMADSHHHFLSVVSAAVSVSSSTAQANIVKNLPNFLTKFDPQPNLDTLSDTNSNNNHLCDYFKHGGVFY